MSAAWDLVLVGAGLANGLIAWRLRQLRPELRVLLLEAGAVPGGNHTWSFQASDLTSAQLEWLDPLICARWAGYEVRFLTLQRQFESPYCSIFSERFAEVITADLGESLRTSTAVRSLAPTWVELESGERIEAQAVIDGRGVEASPHLALGYQAFVGQELRLTEPHGLTRPILMDATVSQGQGYRFVYVLPFAPDRLLIEDTHYIDAPVVDAALLREHIAAYASAHGWCIEEVMREEQGVLPITLAGNFAQFWQAAAGQPRSGLRAGLFHATTGYSLPHAVRLAELVSAAPELDAETLFSSIRSQAEQEWRRQAFFRLLNRMLFLAGRPEERWQVMQRFYGLPAGLIQRFYAGRLTLPDKARILTGKPPVPVLAAARAAMTVTPQQLRNRA
ncbi:lycopene beta-cyclase CrtY [Pseudomonas sp. gcc21]|uniref:lycopene beta-cyclase CrtY n=1 Tax=Pseudomonas sp. gcc21 TaxID=2726989 RepID=UPI0014524D88|nr:lycopene beta-cyclase CrtY [Pseudomonas sp. gcc21]QJD58909.1 lycopene beta-cyclase CrtY [Pseudomonas sp. gcc21]